MTHTTNLQQTAMKTAGQKYIKCLLMNVYKFDRVENSVIEGEIAHYRQFLLLQQCFQQVIRYKASESVCIWEKVKALVKKSFYTFAADDL